MNREWFKLRYVNVCEKMRSGIGMEDDYLKEEKEEGRGEGEGEEEGEEREDWIVEAII